MKYSLTWSKTAEDALITAWLNCSSEEKPAFTAAVNALEAELKLHPEDVGESRPDARRMAICLPIAVVYRVHAEDLRVHVESLRVIRHC